MIIFKAGNKIKNDEIGLKLLYDGEHAIVEYAASSRRYGCSLNQHDLIV